MSYSQLVLSEKPYGYWDCANIESGNLKDLTSFNNNASISNVLTNRKPIIYGPGASVKLLENSEITISNTYKLFLKGSESKTASIEFFFSITDSGNNPHQILKIGNFLNCYVISDKIYISSMGKVATIQVDTWEKSQYVCIVYGSTSVSMSINNIEPVSVSLGEDFQFPDSSPPDIVFGPSAGQDKPLYINCIALYTYALIFPEMLMRQSWSSYSPKAENIAISNNADIINPSVNSLKPNFSYSISNPSRFLEGQFSNIVINNNHITMPTETPVQIQSLYSSLNYDIDINGVSLDSDSYINLTNAYKYLTGNNNIIRMQVQFDGLSTNQTIFNVGPFMDRTSLLLYKSSNNKIILLKISSAGAEEILYESSDLGADFTEYFDISLTFLDGYGVVRINEIISESIQLSNPSAPLDFYLGNSFNFETPSTSRIKNFCIDKYSENDPIIYTNTGLYTLKFNNSLSVSQFGYWNYTLPIPKDTVSSLVTYNYSSKNSQLFINNSLIQKTTLIPNIQYDGDNVLDIQVELKTEDSFNDPCVFSGLLVSTYDSTYISSANGRYRISNLNPIQGGNEIITDPFILRYNRNTVLDRSDNIGIKFSSVINTEGDFEDDLEISSWTATQTNITSGALLIINDNSSSNDIEVLEFIIQLDRTPSVDEEFCIFDINGSNISMMYSDDGVVTSSGYTLYIDGQVYTSGSYFEENEFYHVLLKFNSPVSSIINLGINNERTKGLDGSMGFFAVHNQTPSSVANYATSRYNAIVGRPFISKSDTDVVNITDLPESTQVKEYSQDGKYFSMTELPKIKIVQNKWLTVK